MARGPLAPFLRYLHARRHAADADAALLARYTADRDDSAFAELVRRHGPLVWRVCRQVLGHDQDAEDAFQATFFLLARGAALVRDGAAVAGWLHGTAWRVAHKARAAATARRERERHAAVGEVGDAAAEAALRELQTMLHEEIARLPAKYRTPFVLCVLEGRGRAAVARSLGWNESTLAARLAWARQRLRTRLARRGVDVGAALCAADLARGAAPAGLMKATAAAAVTGVAPASVAVLIQGGIGTVFTTKVQQLTAVALLATALTAGTAGLRGIGSRDASQPVAQPKTLAVETAQPGPAPPTITVPVTVTGTATGPDGKPVPGATVHLMSELGQANRPLASTSTDDRGRYEFREAPVPLTNADAQSDELCLSVFGTAPGLAFSWHPRKYPQARRLAPPDVRADEIRYAAEAQVMDITFGTPAHFEGRIADEHGQPVVGAKVSLRFCDRIPPKVATDAMFYAASAAPETMTTATSGQDGRFRLEGMPRELIATLRIGHPQYADVQLYATTAEPPLPDLSDYLSLPHVGPDNPARVNPIEVTLTTARTVPIQVVVDTSGQPVPGAFVALLRSGKDRSFSSGKTDATGKVPLRMPPGDYTLLARAPREDDGFVQSVEKVNIPSDTPMPQRTVRLILGGVMRIDTVDADTKQPIGSVIFRLEPLTPPIGWGSVDSETGFRDNSYQTDMQGQLRIVARPGTRQITLRSTQYEIVTAPAQQVDLPPGQEVKLRFELRKKVQPPAPPGAAQAPQPTTVPVTVTGTAAGPDNQPVKGATIFLMTQNGALVASTTSDENGKYELRNAPVPLRDPGDEKDATSRVLQVCGSAPGLAFAWKPRYSVELAKGPGNQPLTAAESQQVNLFFGKPEAFRGRIVDEQGRPVEGVKIHLRHGDWLRRLWASGETSFDTIGGALPPAMNTATTDADGRFRIDGVPQNFLAWLRITYADYANVDVYATTADSPLPGNLSHFMVDPDPGPENPVWIGNIDVTLVPPRAIPVRVVSDKTGEPLKDVRVWLGNRGQVRVGSWGQTDAAGRVALRMPPGKYKFYTLGPFGAGYIRLHDEVTVTPAPAEQPRTVRLVPGCTVEVEAVDADTGFPIRHVRFEIESASKPGTWGPLDNSETGYIDGIGGRPTDKWGKLTAVVESGKRTIRPAARFVAVGEIKPVELPAGETVKLRMLVRERE